MQDGSDDVIDLRCDDEEGNDHEIDFFPVQVGKLEVQRSSSESALSNCEFCVFLNNYTREKT